MTNTFDPLPIAFSMMAKPTGPDCNLACDYCYYLSKEALFPPGRHLMSPPVLEEFIRQYIAFQSVPVIQFIWHGGEPMMCGREYFENIIELQKKHARGKEIENILQTNGTLLDDAWGKFLHKHQFLVGISIDGPQTLHDMYRKNHSGRTSFSEVMRGVEILKKHRVEFNTMSVVHSGNAAHGKEVYQFLKSIGSRFMQFTPIVEPLDSSDHPAMTPWSVAPDAYGNFLCAVFDQWIRQDVGTWFVPTFDSILANRVGEPPSICIWGSVCGHAGAIEYDGSVYSCDHYVYPEHRIGSVLSGNLAGMMYAPKQLAFGQSKESNLPEECLQCPYLSLCHGECPKNRFPHDNGRTHGVNYLCRGLKKFFAHTEPYMEYMANELRANRAPMNVMRWKEAPWKLKKHRS